MHFGASLRFSLSHQVYRSTAARCARGTRWFAASRHILHCRRERKAPSIGLKFPARFVLSVEY